MGKRESAGPFLLVFLHKHIEHQASPAGKVRLASAVEEQPAGGEQGTLSLRQGWALSPEAVDRHRALSLPPPPDRPLRAHPAQLLGAQGSPARGWAAPCTQPCRPRRWLQRREGAIPERVRSGEKEAFSGVVSMGDEPRMTGNIGAFKRTRGCLVREGMLGWHIWRRHTGGKQRSVLWAVPWPS